MKPSMRIAALIAGSLLMVSGARAELLSPADRETLLENLERLRDTAASKVDARFRVAIARYRSAMGSDKATLDFYLECIELVNFKNHGRKTSEYLDWKSREHDRLVDPAFRLALQYQLNWLVLSLRAASDKTDRRELAADAQQLVDSIMAAADKLAGQDQVLAQAATSSIFAQAYDISGVENEKWPSSPVQLEEFYERVVFPPLRSPDATTALRGAWLKRIQQEGIKVQAWGGRGGRPNPGSNNGRRNDKGDRPKIGMADDKNPEMERFMTEVLPELQWRMEVDLFRSGDEAEAAKRMLAHVEKYLGHRSARRWGDEFKNLLKPAPKPAAPAPTVE